MKTSLLNNIKKNFSTIPNALINDNELSTQARFLFVYLASKPNDWVFYQDALCKNLGWSGDTFRKYVAELNERGWISRKRQILEGNRFGHWEYEIYEYPVNEISSSENFRIGNFPNRKKSALTKKDFNKKELITKKDDEREGEILHVNGQDRRVNQPAPYPSSADWFEVSKKDKNWKEVTCKTSYINKRCLTEQEFDLLLPYFYTIRKAQGVQWKSERDFKSHFNNWLRTAPIGETLQMLKPAAKNERPPIEDITESQREEAVKFAKAMLADKKRTIY